MRRKISVALICLYLFCVIPIKPYASVDVKSSVEQSLLDFLKSDNFHILVTRGNYSYMQFVPEYKSNALEQYLMEMSSFLLQENSKPESNDYITVLANIITLCDLDGASEVAELIKMDHMKTAGDYMSDMTELAVDLYGVYGGLQTNTSEVAETVEMAVDAISAISDNTSNWIDAVSNLETVLADFSKYDRFLGLMEDKGNDRLRSAASLMRTSLQNALNIKLGTYLDISDQNFGNYTEFFFNDVLFKAAKQTETYKKDNTFRTFIDAGDNFRNSGMVLFDSFKTGLDIGKLIGNITVGSDNMKIRLMEMEALYDISVILQTKILDVYPLFVQAYYDNASNPYTDELINDCNMLVACRHRGEYCLLNLLVNDSGLLSWFNQGKNQEINEWYESTVSVLSNIKADIPNIYPSDKEQDDVTSVGGGTTTSASNENGMAYFGDVMENVLIPKYGVLIPGKNEVSLEGLLFADEIDLNGDGLPELVAGRVTGKCPDGIDGGASERRYYILEIYQIDEEQESIRQVDSRVWMEDKDVFSNTLASYQWGCAAYTYENKTFLLVDYWNDSVLADENFSYIYSFGQQLSFEKGIYFGDAGFLDIYSIDYEPGYGWEETSMGSPTAWTNEASLIDWGSTQEEFYSFKGVYDEKLREYGLLRTDKRMYLHDGGAMADPKEDIETAYAALNGTITFLGEINDLHVQQVYTQIIKDFQGSLDQYREGTSNDMQVGGEEPSSRPEYEKYRQLILEYESKYGNAKVYQQGEWQAYLEGLCFAKTVDFNRDGTEELLVVYGLDNWQDGYYSCTYTFEIWQYNEGDLTLVDTGELYGTDAGVQTVHLASYNGQTYLLTGGADSFSYNYYHGYDGADFGVVREALCDDLFIPDGMYTVNGQIVHRERWIQEEELWKADLESYSMNSNMDSANQALAVLEETKKKLGIQDMSEVNAADNNGGSAYYVYDYAYNINDFGKWVGTIKSQIIIAPISETQIEVTFDYDGDKETYIATKESGNTYSYTPQIGIYPGYVGHFVWDKDQKRVITLGAEDGEGYYFLVSENDVAANSWNSAYHEILMQYYNVINTNDISLSDRTEQDFVNYVLYYGHSEDYRGSFLITDIDGNGIPELLVGAVDDILDFYTWQDNQVIRLLYQPGERANMCLCENGIIYEHSSGGAASSFYRYFRLREDGKSCDLFEYYDVEGDHGNDDADISVEKVDGSMEFFSWEAFSYDRYDQLYPVSSLQFDELNLANIEEATGISDTGNLILTEDDIVKAHYFRMGVEQK